MRRGFGIFLMVLVLVTPVWAAPFLAWDAVLTDSDGLPFAPGLDVTEYRIYQCLSASPGCSKFTATRVGTVSAPATQFDLVGQPTPVVYVVTAVNKAGESGDSVTLKVTPPMVPKNLRLQASQAP